MRVNTAGFYQISFKTLGQSGDDIALSNASRSLVAGNNDVNVNLSPDKLFKTDGPCKVVSLLMVSGPGNQLPSNRAAAVDWHFQAGDEFSGIAG